jgi:hypothetical protein
LRKFLPTFAPSFSRTQEDRGDLAQQLAYAEAQLREQRASLPEPRIVRRNAPTPRRAQLGHNYEPGLTRTERLLLVSRQEGKSAEQLAARFLTPWRCPVHADAFPFSNGSVDRDDITHRRQRGPHQVPLRSRRSRRERYGEQ